MTDGQAFNMNWRANWGGVRSAMLGGGTVTFSSLSPSLWMKSDAGLTLSTTAFAGTGTVTQVATDLTGVGTAFLTEVVIGDTLSGTGITGTVVSIADATHLVLSASDVGAGVAFNINPTAGVTDRITTPADQGAAAFTMTQATAINKPALILNVLAGKPGMLFSGKQFFSRAAKVVASGDFNWFVVASGIGVSGRLLLQGLTASGSRIGLFTNATPVLEGIVDGTNVIDITTTLVQGTAYLMELDYDGATTPKTNLRLNGVSEVTQNNAMTTSGDRTTLGANSNVTAFWSGYVFEVLCYAGLTTSQRALVRNYLADRWGLSVTNP